jgi:hypothetical protein
MIASVSSSALASTTMPPPPDTTVDLDATLATTFSPILFARAV